MFSTSGVTFTGTTSSLVVQGNSSASVTLSGRCTEAGLLVIRGCSVELPGLERHDVLIPVLTDEEQQSQHFETLARINAEEKQKCTSIIDRLRKAREHQRLSMQEPPSKRGPPKYLEVQIVPEQPTLRIRRTSLTNGAVMLYDGETLVLSYDRLVCVYSCKLALQVYDSPDHREHILAFGRLSRAHV